MILRNEDRARYFVMDNAAIRDASISMTARGVLSLITSLLNEDERAVMDSSHFSDNDTQPEIDLAIGDLLAAGYLTLEGEELRLK